MKQTPAIVAAEGIIAAIALRVRRKNPALSAHQAEHVALERVVEAVKAVKSEPAIEIEEGAYRGE